MTLATDFDALLDEALPSLAHNSIRIPWDARCLIRPDYPRMCYWRAPEGPSPQSSLIDTLTFEPPRVIFQVDTQPLVQEWEEDQATSVRFTSAPPVRVLDQFRSMVYDFEDAGRGTTYLTIWGESQERDGFLACEYALASLGEKVT